MSIGIIFGTAGFIADSLTIIDRLKKNRKKPDNKQARFRPVAMSIEHSRPARWHVDLDDQLIMVGIGNRTDSPIGLSKIDWAIKNTTAKSNVVESAIFPIAVTTVGSMFSMKLSDVVIPAWSFSNMSDWSMSRVLKGMELEVTTTTNEVYRLPLPRPMKVALLEGHGKSRFGVWFSELFM